MIYSIPVQSTTDPFSQQVELDGLIFDLTFLWNARDGHWFLTVGRDSAVLVSQVKLIHVDNLLLQYRRISGLPAGRLYLHDLDGLDRDPEETLFGDRVLLLYEEAA